MANTAPDLEPNDTIDVAEDETPKTLQSDPVPAPETASEENQVVEAREKQLQTLRTTPLEPRTPDSKEVADAPSFEEARERIEAIEYGDHKALRSEADKINAKSSRLIVIHSSKDGWHCGAVKADTEFVSVDQSEELAKLINDKIDAEKMKKDAEAAREIRNRKKTKQSSSKAPEAKEESDSYDELLEILEGIQNLSDLTELVAHCREHNLLEVSGGRNNWRVKGIDGNEKSNELAKGINTKKQLFLKEIRINRGRINAVLQEIEYCPNSEELDKFVWNLHQRERIVKEFTGPEHSDWVAHPVKGIQGSKEVTNALNKRREELVKNEAAEKAAKEEKARAELRKKFKR